MSPAATDESFLQRRLEQRRQDGSLRSLSRFPGLVDFSSNDYLGLARVSAAVGNTELAHGSTGSRLLSGNSETHEQAEAEIASFYHGRSALLFNSGYDANLGLLSAVPGRTDTILYDELAHASIRDGARLSLARSFSFRHNDLDDLDAKLRQARGERFVVVESVYSMDGDLAPLADLARICAGHAAHLCVDEAHATGVYGPRGEGRVVDAALTDAVFARVHTFGKALGAHGAAVIGSRLLRDALINFARSFIYTTAMPPASVEAVRIAHTRVQTCDAERLRLRALVAAFGDRAGASLGESVAVQPGPIQVLHVAGNDRAREASAAIRLAGLDVRPILSPTVPQGRERLRVCLHSFNSTDEIDRLLICARPFLVPRSAAEVTP